MAKSRHPAPRPRRDTRHVIWLSERDMNAARRLLGLLAEEGRRAPAASQDDPREAADAPGRQELLKRGREQYFLRQRRHEIFGKRLSSEHAFDLLVSLYVFEAREPDLTATRLAEISRVSPSSVLRWLGILEKAGFIQRKAVATDRRMAEVRLSDRGRRALEEFLGWAPE